MVVFYVLSLLLGSGLGTVILAPMVVQVSVSSKKKLLVDLNFFAILD